MVQGWSSTADAEVVRHARVIPLDVVQAKGAGHAGTAVGLTPALYMLFQDFLRHDPADPNWRGRDRFVLSAGHASLGLYLQLWLSGYGLEMDDLRAARTLDSRTPGHPEFGHTSGVETTTGPLGQGIGNAVGMALEAERLRHVLKTDLYSPRVWCFASDGDVEEGISHEASSLAGTLQPRGLILVWDDNAISIEGATGVAFTEDVAARYAAYGWQVLTIEDAEDPVQVRAGYERAQEMSDAGPVFVRLRSRIGHPMPTVGGTAGAHSGAPGADEVRATKEVLGLDPELSFSMPDDLLAHARAVTERGAALHREWDAAVATWRSDNPAEAETFERLAARDATAALPALAELRANPRAAATRVASGAVLEQIMPALPQLWGGSADLADSNGTGIRSVESYVPATYDDDTWPGVVGGQLLHFGIREHAMGAIVNGIALGGLSLPFGATFFVFSDYMRPSVRLAALMNLPSTFVWSHDSVAVGEDGPTHQPLEHLWSYRAIVGLSLVRPADWVETVDAWRRIVEHPGGPHALVLSRQSVPVVAEDSTYETGAARGAYTVWQRGEGTPDAIIIATGSEVAPAIEAATQLSDLNVRVVSAPCLEWFEMENTEYREQVLPAAVRSRVSVEAGTDQGWYRWVGTDGRAVSISGYGQSGAGDELLKRLGITVEAITDAVRASVAQVRG
ncbi:transketolase family protein [Microbacterium koreense]|uniref:Transketolase family protein n=1 Tax=Microbacterium koreense TaxID=323761 RepID=A0ABW2ZUC3_9MICO